MSDSAKVTVSFVRKVFILCIDASWDANARVTQFRFKLAAPLFIQLFYLVIKYNAENGN